MGDTVILKRPPVGKLSKIISDYICFKRSLGYKYDIEEGILYNFSAFTINYTVTGYEIPTQMIEDWLSLRKGEKSKTQRTRFHCTLQVLRYAREHGYRVVLPEIPKFHVTEYIPYIFSKCEVEKLFYASDHIKPYPGSLRHVKAPVLLRLIYGCGLRASEAANLKTNDVDFTLRTITIREGKLKKDRIVPLSDSLAKIMQQYYLRFCQSSESDSYFFKGKYRQKLNRSMIYYWFRYCLEKAGIHHYGKGKGPREHDLRHSFCIHSLQKMQAQGIDLYAFLPVLSTYLGHVSIYATQRYLRLTAEFYPDLLKQVNETCSGIIPSWEVNENETH